MKYGPTNRWTKRVIPIYAHQNTLFARGMIRSGKGYVSTQNVLFDGEFKPQTGAELSEETTSVLLVLMDDDQKMQETCWSNLMRIGSFLMCLYQCWSNLMRIGSFLMCLY